jgi:lipoprotein-anchoring transpeptidase ErfK/SrfK
VADDLERQLAAVFDVQARDQVPDDGFVPPARFLVEPAPRRRWLAPVAAAAAVVAIVGSVLGLQAASDGGHPRPAAGRTSTSAAAPVTGPVRVTMPAASGSYGVGMPVVAYFSKRFPSAKPLAAATSVTVNGKPVRAAWYFERSTVAGYPVEGHLRMRDYWPSHAYVHVVVAANGVTPAATTSFRTGARTIAVVRDAKHEMVVTRDGKQLGPFPVSLGAAATPTMRGTKVIMAKKPSVCLTGPSFAECGVKYAQQLTYAGEYLIAAPWNPGVEGHWDSSNGCTNLTSADARLLYNVMQVGDVVRFPDTKGPAMKPGGGYGDWNVRWSTWLRGGLIPS